MSFDPIDVSALKRRKREQGSRLDAMLAKERSAGLDRRGAKSPSAGKTVQVNVRLSVDDKAFLGELAAERRTTVVELVTEAIQLLRAKHGR